MSEKNEVSSLGASSARRKTVLRLLGIGLVLLGLGVSGVWYYRYVTSYESIDDAFITGPLMGISPRVAGTVWKIYVQDNQGVREGNKLVDLDPRDFQLQVEKAKAQRDEARAVIRESQAGVVAAQAGEATAQSEVEEAALAVSVARTDGERMKARSQAAQAQAQRDQADVKRYRALRREHLIAPQEFEHVRAAALTSQANWAAAQAERASSETHRRQAEAALKTARSRAREATAQAAQAQAALEAAQAVENRLNTAVTQAQLNLSYTHIQAPASGRVTGKSVEIGMVVVPGQTLMTLVSSKVWVVANFKETQIGPIRPGLPVTLKVDAYPDHLFHGHVDSLQAGTGSVFSLLPPENATGNYVKVVQRVPVKIVFDLRAGDRPYLLAPGLSVVPQVWIVSAPEKVPGTR